MSWIIIRKDLERIRSPSLPTLLLTLLLLSLVMPSYVQSLSKIEQTTSNDLDIQPLIQRKDTPMLCLEGCSLYGDHAWDKPHSTRGCEHDDWYCIPASIAMIASYYGGNLSQDPIANYVLREYYNHCPESDLAHAGGLGVTAAGLGLSWALNGAEISKHEYMLSFDEIKELIDLGQPIVRYGRHFTVIDGYNTNGQLVHVINPWTGTESAIPYDELSVQGSLIPPANATARSDESEIWMDSDRDGIVDFDETNRFFTDPYNPDTDRDGIDDKTEIRSYTFLSDDSFDEEDIRLPDSDEDGLRAELDRDSDNGGCPDGLEDLNCNGKLDTGETDPFNATDDPDRNDLGIEPKLQRKDTPMLCLQGCSLYGDHAWDKPHPTRGCEHDDWYCIPASIGMIASYYGGNINQDPIIYHVLGELLSYPPEFDLGHGRGLGVDEATMALSWALNNVEILHEWGEKPPLEQFKQWIDQGRPIMIQYAFHWRVIGGYTGEYLHVLDPWNGKESKIHYNNLNIYHRWIPPADAVGRNNEPGAWDDDDEDGVCNFDELNRFFADPYSNDTDNDGILDKIEIQSYTFIDGVFDEEDIIKPDADEDGFRAELDPDDNNSTIIPESEFLPTDLNKDGTINIHDLFVIAKAYQSHGPDIPNPGDPSSENWNATADLNKDNRVNIWDLYEVARDYGKTV